MGGETGQAPRNQAVGGPAPSLVVPFQQGQNEGLASEQQSRGGKEEAGATRCTGMVSHKPTLGQAGGSCAPGRCGTAEAGRVVGVGGDGTGKSRDGMGKSWQRVFGWGCRVHAELSSHPPTAPPPAPLQPPRSPLPASLSAEEFGGD